MRLMRSTSPYGANSSRTSCSVTVNARFPTKICTGCPFWASAIRGRHQTARKNGAIGHAHQPRGARRLRGAHTLAGTCPQRYVNHASAGGGRDSCVTADTLCPLEETIVLHVTSSTLTA